MRSLNNAPWLVRAGADGRMFGCHFGTVTTPLATPATTALAAARPQAWMTIPNGTLVIPTSVRIVVESAGATTQGEISLCSTTNDVGNGTSAAGTSGALNTNTGSTITSLAVPRQLATADVTAETGLLEHARFIFQTSIGVTTTSPQIFTWPAPGNSDELPFLRGPASWLVYIGGNAVNFYAQFKWVEYPEAAT